MVKSIEFHGCEQPFINLLKVNNRPNKCFVKDKNFWYNENTMKWCSEQLSSILSSKFFYWLFIEIKLPAIKRTLSNILESCKFPIRILEFQIYASHEHSLQFLCDPTFKHFRCHPCSTPLVVGHVCLDITGSAKITDL